MVQVWKRLFGAQAKVCAMLAVLASIALAQPQKTSSKKAELLVRPAAAAASSAQPVEKAGNPAPRRLEPEVFDETPDQAGIVAYAPRQGEGPWPIAVMLHGMCSEPERACRHFASTLSEQGFLVCPRARKRCDGGGSTWPQSVQADVEAGIERVKAAHAGQIDDTRGRLLIGFSLGAFRGLDLAQNAHGEYPRVILIGAKIYPDPRRLRAAGVERLLLAAGDWDMMHGHMQDRARLLQRQGFPAAFQSFGPVGHAFPANFPEILSRAVEWTQGDDQALIARL
ncbi:MAG TPA: hypothetical protein VGP93_17640 [Polyangiaceae bacterium]|jgi:predicted esterase|nr:hypothetical protein [Polyangiaceae bacterium]